MSCPMCGSSDWIVVDSNGASYPETLIEQAVCRSCDHEFRNVLVA